MIHVQFKEVFIKTVWETDFPLRGFLYGVAPVTHIWLEAFLMSTRAQHIQ